MISPRTSTSDLGLDEDGYPTDPSSVQNGCVRSAQWAAGATVTGVAHVQTRTVERARRPRRFDPPYARCTLHGEDR
jgi:hypothetical protein